MEPQHFNWLTACNALVLLRHEMERAELRSAKEPTDPALQDEYVRAWHAHHAALADEFVARHCLK